MSGFETFKHWAVVNQQLGATETITALAHNNTLMNLSITQQQPILHFWTLPQNVILGMMDTKLPNFAVATQWLTDNHYDYAVRNVGGLGVVSNQGVLNVSCYLPDLADQLSINQAYELIQTWLTQTFATDEHPIKSFEVTHSYCPGRYDLSIAGQKFAGIAQRRRKNGIAIQLYISVLGDQNKRGQLMQTFYTRGQAQEQTQWHFPDVIPASMANLANLLDQPLTPALVQQRLLVTFQQAYQVELSTDLTAALNSEAYQQGLTRQIQLLQRYQK